MSYPFKAVQERKINGSAEIPKRKHKKKRTRRHLGGEAEAGTAGADEIHGPGVGDGIEDGVRTAGKERMVRGHGIWWKER